MPTAPLVIWLSALCVIAALALIVYSVSAARPTMSAKQLLAGAAPSLRQLSLDRSALERLADGVLGGVRSLSRRATSASMAEETDRRIGRAGMSDRWTADRFIAMKGLVSLAVFLVLFIVALAQTSRILPLLAASLAALAFFVPDLIITRKGSARDQVIQRDLGDIVDQILIAVEAGASLDSSIDRISRHSDGPIQAEFRRVLQDIALGMSRKEALVQMTSRTTLPEMRSLLLSISQSEEHGLSIGNVLRVQAGEIRDKRQRRAEEAAMKVPVKIVFPLILTILPCLMVIIIGPAVVQISQNLNF